MRKWGGLMASLLAPVLILCACGSLSVEKFYQNGAVVTSSPIASEIGLNILKRGGNAFDAAVGVGFALAVCHPEAGNIGGGGFALIYESESGEIRALDFREKAPLAATANMYLDQDSNVIENSSLIGARACGVPGTVAGLYCLWKDYGSLDWYNLLEQAIMLADTGFIVDDYLANSLAYYTEDLKTFPETEAIFVPDDAAPASADRLVQKDLAATIQRIGLDSLKGFYSGKTADLIVETMTKYGGLIDHNDLLSYQAVWRAPLKFSFDSLEVYSMPPPSSGGVILGMILGLIEPYDFYQFTPKSAEYIHLFTEACRLAFAERAVHLADPDFIDNPVAAMLNPLYLDSRRELIDPYHAGNSMEIESGIPRNTHQSESTTHFSIVDRLGNVVSLTYTLNTMFGSHLVVGGAGFLLNSEMDDFSIKPGVPNVWGLTGGRANEIASGKRMLSSMSPTIVTAEGKPILALGSPGGSKIITTVAEAIINMTRFKLNVEQAVNQPRFHHQWFPDTLYLEQGGFDINIMQDLIAKGHIIKERSPYSELQIIYIDGNSMMTAAADPRRNGKACGY